jgi:hypothetical protein
MKKRYILAACGLALCLGLTACGGSNEVPTTAPTATQSTAPQAPTDGPQQETQPIPNNTEWLTNSAEPVVEMKEEKRGNYDNGTFYYTDVTEDGKIRRIHSCYVNTIRENEPEDEYVRRRALGLAASIAPGTPYDIHITYNEELSEALGYPVYLAGYFTGSDDSAKCWLIYLTRTEHYSYQYAFVSEPETGILYEPKFVDYFKTMALEPMAS